jgi:transposase
MLVLGGILAFMMVPLSKAAEAVGRTKRMILNWVRGLGRGVEALRDKHRSGRPRKVSREFIAEKIKPNPKLHT